MNIRKSSCTFLAALAMAVSVGTAAILWNRAPTANGHDEPVRRGVGWPKLAKVFGGFSVTPTEIQTDPVRVDDDWSFRLFVRGAHATNFSIVDQATGQPITPEVFGERLTFRSWNQVKGGTFFFRATVSGAWRIEVWQHSKQFDEDPRPFPPGFPVTLAGRTTD